MDKIRLSSYLTKNAGEMIIRDIWLSDNFTFRYIPIFFRYNKNTFKK